MKSLFKIVYILLKQWRKERNNEEVYIYFSDMFLTYEMKKEIHLLRMYVKHIARLRCYNWNLKAIPFMYHAQLLEEELKQFRFEVRRDPLFFAKVLILHRK